MLKEYFLDYKIANINLEFLNVNFFQKVHAVLALIHYIHPLQAIST